MASSLLRNQTGLGAMDKMKAAADRKKRITESGNTGVSRTADPEPQAKKKSFSQAFKEARSEGKSSFTWNGKKYTTEKAGDSKPAAKKTESMPEGNYGTASGELGMFNAKFDKEESEGEGMKRGGKVKKYAKGGSVRGDGCAQRGKTKGRMI